jgi:hypothetical protein
MIEFYFLGALITYKQFNSYIDHSFKFGSNEMKVSDMMKCNDNISTTKKKKQDYEFNRYEFLLISLYNLLFALFLIVSFVYSVYVFETVMMYLSRSDNNDSNDYVILKSLGGKHPFYKKILDENDLFSKFIFKAIVISLVSNFVFLQILILFRGSRIETNRDTIKKELKLMTFVALLFFCLSFLTIF